MGWPMGIIDEAIKTGELPVSAEAVPPDAGGQGGFSFTHELDRQEREELYQLRQDRKEMRKRLMELEADLVILGRRCEMLKTVLIMVVKDGKEES